MSRITARRSTSFLLRSEFLDHGLDIAESRVPYLKVREICNNPDDKDDDNDDDVDDNDDDDIVTRASAARSFSN